MADSLISELMFSKKAQFNKTAQKLSYFRKNDMSGCLQTMIQ